MRPRLPSVTWAYVALAAAFLLMAAFRQPFGDGLRYPTLLFQRNPAQDLGGLVPRGLWQLDQVRLRRSIARTSSVRLAREAGNSLRVASGQVLEWIIWGGREPLMLFPNIELWISAGLTPKLEADLSRAAAIIAGFDRRLRHEGWSLVVVPVPPKLGVHRELARWPVRERDLMSDAPIAADRSDEVYGYFIEALRRETVGTVDLQRHYRDEIRRRPSELLYVPGDSHWTGEGIRIAAEATAIQIASQSPVMARKPVDPTYHEFDHEADMAKAFDVLQRFPTWLAPVMKFRERLMNGEAGKGYVYPAKPSSLVVVVGTSYTGQYTWVPQPVGFVPTLGLHLRDARLLNRATAGKGSFYSFELFWSQRHELAAEFAAGHGASLPRIVVWEFPLRDMQNILASGAALRP